MANLNLERLNFLVVDDSDFALRLVSSVLYKLGVGNVINARGGVEAVEILKTISTDPMRLGVQSIDVVICDWVMPQIDGAMVLRWIRRHPDSPNRFMPFIMISGMADQEKVNEARALGVNEFLAKPFSIDSVTEKIRTLVNNPRLFVYNYEYFGPDRRRQNLPFEGDNRRIMKPEDTETIHSGKDPEKLQKKPKVWFFNLPNRLKEISSSLGAKGEVADFDPKLLEIAEQQIESLEEDYMQWVEDKLREMFEHFSQIKINDPVEDIIKRLVKINGIAHEARGQGSTFGYPLITEFNQSLFEFTRIYDRIDEGLIELIRAHMDAIKVIMRDRIKDDGGQIGKELTQSLEKAKEKYKISQRSQ